MQDFNYHTHTYRCGHADLDYTDEEYIKEHIKMGFKKMAFTDHCPEKNEIDKRPNVRMKYSQKKEYLSSVSKLKDKYKSQIEIETGYEVEYLPGEEENLLELKNEVDKIILGQHFVYADDGHDLRMFWESDFSDNELLRYAEYVKKAMELGIPNIIAHPDLFMKGRSSFGELEEKTSHIICQTAEKYDIPLEINLNCVYYKTYGECEEFDELQEEIKREKMKKVEYPCKQFWNIAKDYNVRVVYGIDAHHKGQISLFPKVVKLANDIIGQDIKEKLNFIKAAF